MRCCTGVLLVVATVAGSHAAHAQTSDARARADALFREGRHAATTGDYARACERFAESQRLDPSTGTLLNLGDCEEHQGHLSSARNYYRTALAQLGGSDPRVPPAKERLDRLEARMPRLTIRIPASPPPGLVVTCDGTPLPAAEIGVPGPIDPGEHVVLVTAPGHKERPQTVSLGEGESREVIATPGEPEEIASPAVPSPSSEAPTPEPSSSARTVGWLLGAGGVVGLGIAAVSGVVLLDDKSTVQAHCPQKQCDSVGLDAVNGGKTWLVVNAVGWVAGVVGLGAGAVLVLTSPGGGRTSLKAGVVAIPGGALAGASASF